MSTPDGPCIARHISVDSDDLVPYKVEHQLGDELFLDEEFLSDNDSASVVFNKCPDSVYLSIMGEGVQVSMEIKFMIVIIR